MSQHVTSLRSIASLPALLSGFLVIILTACLFTILPVSSFTSLGLPHWIYCLIGLMFVFDLFACLLVSAYWITPVHVERSDCHYGTDTLPGFTTLIVRSSLNKLLQMDSNTASASSLHTEINYFSKYIKIKL